MALLARQSGVSAKVFSASPVKPAAVPRSVRCKSYVPMELIAAAGDVEAPLGVPIIAAIVVTAAVTFAVPAYLNRGQQAADKIFDARGKPQPKVSAKAAKAGKKAPPAKRR